MLKTRGDDRRGRLVDADLAARPLAQSRFMYSTTGGFYLLGGSLGDIVTILMPAGPGSKPLVIAMATFAIVFGLLLIGWGARLRPLYNEHIVGAGIIIIATAVLASTNDIGAMALSSMFIFAAVDAAFFFPYRQAVFYVAFAALCNLVTLPIRPDLAWWSGLMGAGVTLGTGAITSVLARRAANADIDPLTGLLNRRGFDRLLNQELGLAGRTKARPAIVLFDLDDFKLINDTNGHGVGDTVLVEIAETWRHMCLPPAQLARYGGDEFALLLPEASEDDALAIADSFRDAISIGCSAGATSWSLGESASLLVSRADVALYRAKQAGRNRTMLESVHLPPMAEELKETLTLLKVHFQPIVRLDEPGNPIVAVEALVRWPSTVKPGVQAEETIRIAEANDLIDVVDRAVMRRACAEAVVMQRAAGPRKVSLHVNVSGLSLIKPDFLDGVHEVLRDTGWPNSQLVLEITESVVDADKKNALAKIAELRATGIRIAIDDFGTGYSSLSRLQTLPADELKLDGAFVDSITSHGSGLLEAVASLGRALGLPMIAEGVEDADQAALLARLGYPMAQGYYYGRPMALNDLCIVLSVKADAVATTASQSNWRDLSQWKTAP